MASCLSAVATVHVSVGNQRSALTVAVAVVVAVTVTVTAPLVARRAAAIVVVPAIAAPITACGSVHKGKQCELSYSALMDERKQHPSNRRWAAMHGGKRVRLDR